MQNKKFWATTLTLSGTIIGAGILGLPYIFAQSGFLFGLFWLLIIGSFVIFTNLVLGEIVLRTKGKHQLTGYAKKYLGKWGERVMLFAMLFGIYSSLLAYLIGEGKSLSQLFTGGVEYAIIFTVGFWIILTLILREGLKGLKKIETWGVIAIIAIILTMLAWFSPSINMQNLYNVNPHNFFLPIGVILFALLGFVAIPEIRSEIRGEERHLKKAIVIGTLIPIVLYILFTFTFIGVLGTHIQKISTLSLGPLMVLLGVFTMFTSYLVLSFSIKDMYRNDFGFSKGKTIFWTNVFPLLLYFVSMQIPGINFISIIGIGGVISGGLTGILILMMSKKSKIKGNRTPEYKMPISIWVVILISLTFLLGTIAELTL